jgi:hypothetical protein
MAMLESLNGVTHKLSSVSFLCHPCMVVTSGPYSRNVYTHTHIYIYIAAVLNLGPQLQHLFKEALTFQNKAAVIACATLCLYK